MFDDQNLVSPKKFANLIAWWDANQIIGLNDGDPISQWNDLSGNENHLLQADAAKKPVYKISSIPALNGLPYVWFDGINDYLVTADFSTTYAQPNTIFILGRFRNIAQESIAYFGGNGVLFAYSLASPGFSHVFAGAPTAARACNYIAPEVGYYGLVTVVFNGANTLFRDAKSLVVKNVDIGGGGLVLFGVGIYADFTSYAGAIDVAEIIVYNRELSSYERYQIETYLIKKWGIFSFSTFVIDGFTRANSSASMGTCDSNQAWIAGSYQDANNPTIGISSNMGYFPTTPGTDSHAYIETGKANCVITAKIIFDSGGDSDKGIIFRRQDADNYFFLHADSATDTLVLSRCLAGVRSDIASTAGLTIGLGEDVWVRCYLAGDSIYCGMSCKGWYSLSKNIETTDANLMTATKHGLYNHSGNQGAFVYFSINDWG